MLPERVRACVGIAGDGVGLGSIDAGALVIEANDAGDLVVSEGFSLRAKRFGVVFAGACLAALASAAAFAQAIPAATKPLTAQVGGGFSVARSGFGYNYIKGFTAYGNVDYHQRVGIEANLHMVNVFTPDDIGEKCIVVGPRVTFIHGDFNSRPNFVNVYAKFEGGLGFFQYQGKTYVPLTNRYRMLAYGGGIELHVSRHLNVRPVELEYQRWPAYSERGLKPVVATFGAAYQF